MAVFLGSNQKKGGKLIKNGQPPPEFQTEESHLNEDLEDSRFNNLLGLASGSQLGNLKHIDSYSSFVADEKKEVQISTTSPRNKDNNKKTIPNTVEE